MTDTASAPGTDGADTGTDATDDAPGPQGERTDFTGLLVLVGLILALGWFASWSWAFMVVAIIFMIFMHELGH